MYKINTENIGELKKYIWHYRKDDKEYGPFTYEDIVDMVKKGEIGSEDYVLKFGNKKFIKVSEAEGLQDLVVQPPVRPVAQPAVQPIVNTVEQINVVEELPKESIEKPKEDNLIVFESIVNHQPERHKQESASSKIAIGAACIAGLGLAIWVLTRLL